jgi:acyl-CoA synthetase (AMP-forming)/AMP-acid ligase II
MSPEGSRRSATTREHLNVAAYLPEMAEHQPDALAVAVAAGRDGGSPKFVTMTAAELNRRSDRVAHGLVKAGIGEGVRTVLMVKPSADFFALTFAMLKVGAVPVMVDPGMGIENLGQCLAEAEPEAFIGIPKAHVARLLFGWANKTLKTKVTVGPRLMWGGHSLAKLEANAPDDPYPVLDPPAEQTAAILFTSGSTGVPKGVVTPYRVFASQVRMLRSSFGIEPGDRDLATFPLFALFGPALGMASIVPEMDASKPAAADPALLMEAFREFSCTNLFASPALLDRLGRYCNEHGIVLEGLRRAISAGAPASISTLERFQGIVPDGVEIFTPYGATESLPVAVLGTKTILGETRHETEKGGGVCVGEPVPGMQVRVIGITDDPIESWSDVLELEAGNIGEITVNGPVVTHAYYNRPESTRQAKIRDPEGGIWHRMGDVGYFDEQGRLWMCGRKAHRVQTAESTMFTVPCEAVFNAHRHVFRSALVGVEKDGKTQPVICIELERGHDVDPAKLEHDLRDIAGRFGHTRAIKEFLIHPSFPVDVRHNAKIFREKLGVWAQRQLQ